MAACNLTTLLENGRCFYGLNPNMLRVALAQLWCQAAEAIAGMSSGNPSIQSVDDSNWYRLIGIEIAPGDALPWMSQVATAPGANAYLVIADPDTGDKYKVSAWGVPPAVQWQVDPTPTVEAETPTVISVGSTAYNLVIRLDPDPIAVLEPV
jgi:hypothetical protein